MLFGPGMENVFIKSEIADKINGLGDTLEQLCGDYLDGCDSVYSIYFYAVSPPGASSLERSVPLREGIQGFVSGVLGGPMSGFVILDESKADVIRSIGAIPQTQEDLMQVFAAPMLDVLQTLQASVYPLTDEGELLYDDLLEPVVMSISTAAVRIEEHWFILMAEWSD